eukprot:11736561-Alexandrium_andersonii.AAC.1
MVVVAESRKRAQNRSPELSRAPFCAVCSRCARSGQRELSPSSFGARSGQFLRAERRGGDHHA